MLTLTKKEKETLESRHKQSRDGRERDRIKAVLLSDEGWSSLLLSNSKTVNPIERLWQVMNEYARNNQYFATAKLFRVRIEKFFKLILPDIANSLDSRINDNFQKLESGMSVFLIYHGYRYLAIFG